MIPNENTDITIEDCVLFRTASEFSIFITNTAHKSNKSLTETILKYCDERDLSPEYIAKLISKPLKDLLEIEMQNSGLLPKDQTVHLE